MPLQLVLFPQHPLLPQVLVVGYQRQPLTAPHITTIHKQVLHPGLCRPDSLKRQVWHVSHKQELLLRLDG